jgi:hypothetical protein
MTDYTNEPPALDLSQVAEEEPHESIAEERAIVGDEPSADTGGSVPEDDAQ